MQLVFWVTNDCNLCCDYCYEGKNKNKESMTSEIAQKALDMFSNLKSNDITIRFHGGEPLLNIPIIKYIQKYANVKYGRENILYSITSNGCVTSQEAINLLVNTMDDINISIDGPQTVNDLYRKNKYGKGMYDTAIQTALMLKEKVDSHKLNIRMTYNSKTVSTLSKSITHFISLGFNNIIPAPDLFDTKWSPELLVLLQEQLDLAKNNTISNTNANIGGINKQDIKKRGVCDGGITNFHITPNGNIYPCTYVVAISSFCIGNVKDGLNMEKINKLQKIYLQPNQVCDGCSYISFCPNNRCKLVNWALTGNYFIPSGIACAVEHAKINVIGCI